MPVDRPGYAMPTWQRPDWAAESGRSGSRLFVALVCQLADVGLRRRRQRSTIFRSGGKARTRGWDTGTAKVPAVEETWGTGGFTESWSGSASVCRQVPCGRIHFPVVHRQSEPELRRRRSRWHGQAEGPSSPTSAPTTRRLPPGPGSRWQTAGKRYAPDPIAVGTTVSQGVDSQPRSPVRAPTTTDTHPTTTTTTADARSGSAWGPVDKPAGGALHPPALRCHHSQAKS